VLGDLPGRIRVSLVVVADRAADDAPLARWPQAFSADTALVCRGRAVVGPVSLSAGDGAPWSAVRLALRYRAGRAAVILCTAAEIVNHGLPVDKADRALVCGTSLPAEWQRVLARSVAAIRTLPEREAFGDGRAIAALLRPDAVPSLPS